MTDAQNFFLWFIQNLPTFLMSHPVIDFLGFVFAAYALRLLRSLLPG